MSRPDERPSEGAWDDSMPSFTERLGLAIRQRPIRGLVVVLLLLLSFSFLAAGIFTFRDVIWDAIWSPIATLLVGDPTAVFVPTVGLVTVSTVALLPRRG